MTLHVTNPVNTIIGQMSADDFYRLFNEWKHKNPKFNEIDMKLGDLNEGPPFTESPEDWIRTYAANRENLAAVQAEHRRILSDLEQEFCKIIVQ